MNAATPPFAAADARRIAEAFLPRFPLGNRYDYYYVRAKLGSDPLYPGVLAALRGSSEPLLDLGCGLGLLAHALRFDGQTLAYRGVDNDAAKIARARRVAEKCGFAQTQFEVVDLANVTPDHCGSVAILDMLQYLDADAQRALLTAAAAMLTPGAVLVIRSAIDDASGRARTSRTTDRMAQWIGWMQFRPRSWPTLDGLRAPLEAAGLQVESAPLYGNTPFNNWLIVARRA
jgi:cyclopropane fatty-acyl-phospholipid synthase-like methyltransferase